MSKLNWYWAYYPHLDAPEQQKESALHAGYIKVVSKDEADKVITDLEESHKMEVEQLLIEIAEKDKEIARLKAIRKVHVEAIESMGAGLHQDEEEILHQKYKRCLAMAVICFNRAERANCWKEEVKSRKRFEKWRELAEKFKEAK